MIRTLIVDDEPLCLDELKHLLSQYKDINIDFEASNACDALRILQTQTLDLVFLDIEMGNEKAGLKIAKEICKQKNTPKIIFLTAHPQHALKAFDFQPLHYLLKPISQSKLDLAIQRVRDLADTGPTAPDEKIYEKIVNAVHSMEPVGRITIKHRTLDKYDAIIRPTVYLPPNDILYIHKDKLSNTTKIFTIDGKLFEGIRQTLQKFENLLSESNFFRIHTSYLVNLQHVEGQKPRTSGEESNILTLKNTATELPISKLKISALKAALESLD